MEYSQIMTKAELEKTHRNILEAWTAAMRDGDHSKVALYDGILSVVEFDLRELANT